MKRFFYYLMTAFLLVSCLIGIPLFFIGDDFLSDQLAKGLNLKVSPGFVGGELAMDFVDELDDEVSLKEYKVYKPVYDAVWQQNADYWQIEQFYDADARGYQPIKIFIEGRPDELSGKYILDIDKNSALLKTQDEKPLCECEIYFLDGGRLVKTRIPLEKRELQKLYTATETSHSVYAQGKIQTALNVKMDSQGQTKDMKASIKKIKAAYHDQRKKLEIPDHYTGNDAFDKAYKIFASGNFDQAESLLKEIIQKEPDNAMANAYYGSCIAIRAGSSNPFRAMSLVKEAYIFLDQGAKLSAGKGSEIDCLMNRAEVSLSVPESIFKKAEQGAFDFIKCAGLFEEQCKDSILSEFDRAFIAYCYACAAEAYLIKDKSHDAALCLKKGEKFFNM